MNKDFLNEIKPKVEILENHKLYNAISSIEKLRDFMERHVYAVFDFMSLTKALQREFTSVDKIWTPPRDQSLCRFINEIVLCEESDVTPDGNYMSHYDMYCHAMSEIKANSDLPQSFVSEVAREGISSAIRIDYLPTSSLEFMKTTFDFVERGKTHEIASAFCFGREKVIPLMFKSLLKYMNISSKDAPMFHYYLERHIEVDGDSHGPLALKMLEMLCNDEESKWEEAKNAALIALDARIKLWDQVYSEII